MELSIASYNTFLIPTNKHAPNTMPQIIKEIGESDIDIFCLQEIFVPQQTLQIENAVKDIYPYSFAEANELDLETQKIPCSSTQTNAFLSQCVMDNCSASYRVDMEILTFIGCASYFCAEQIFPLIDTECLSCVLFYYPSLFDQDPATISLQEAVTGCSQIPLPRTALTDGTIILSKYPIKNKWIFPFHSNVFHRSLIITEIDISQSSQSESIIVGCTHLQSTDGYGQYFTTSTLEIDENIQSYDELNEWQSEYILDTVFDENVLPWNTHSDDNNVIGVFIAGDFNVGKSAFPQNFNIWHNAGFINVQDLQYDDKNNNFNGCTYCRDPDDDKLLNILAVQGCSLCDFKDADIDHVLVYDESLININHISYNRIFTDIFNISGHMIPLSDHWGVAFQFELKSTKVDCEQYGEIQTDYGSKTKCLTIGKLCNSFFCGLIKHSLIIGEKNLVWQNIDDDNTYCPEFCYKDNKLSLQYEGSRYYLQWDYDLASGNGIERNERNAKIDAIWDGDEFNYSNSNICDIVDGINCCLTVDNDGIYGYQSDAHYGIFKGYEGKFKCAPSQKKQAVQFVAV